VENRAHGGGGQCGPIQGGWELGPWGGEKNGHEGDRVKGGPKSLASPREGILGLYGRRAYASVGEGWEERRKPTVVKMWGAPWGGEH